MIMSMDELILFQDEIFKKMGSDDFNSDVLLRRNLQNNFSEESILSSMPVSYSKVVEYVNVNGVNISGFAVSPSSGDKISLEDKLMDCSRDPFFPKEFMEKHKLYQIGSYNTDIICITEGTEIFLPGEILFIDEGDDIFDPQDDQIHPLAVDFETFLILAGNLNQIYQVIDDEDYDELTKEFERRLKILNIDKRYWPAWVRLI